VIDEPRSFRRPIISPDGSRIILETTLPVDIWVYSLAGKTLSRLGSPEGSTDPLWTPDGKQILYTVPAGSGSRSLEWRNADGTGVSERLITATAGNLFAMDWTDGGRTLIYDESPRGRPATILAFDMAAKTSRLVVESQATVRLPSMSPDGKWIAYESLENGQREIFVSAYPGPGGRSQVSDRGGAEPIWSRDGREIFYRAPRSMMAATVDVRNGAFAVKERRVLFEDIFVVAGTLMYSVFPDGQSFAMMQSDEADRQLALISNIGPELRAKLGMTKK
jgi:serine/threonine-protein kinase